MNEGQQAEREQWGTKIGFILAAAGSAIGLGNVWKFPYITGENGGAAFVLVYLLCIVIIGLPIMLAELVIGRKTQRNPVGAFKILKPGSPWFLVGTLGIMAGFVILSYYSVVAGWMMSYTYKALSGLFQNFPAPVSVRVILTGTRHNDKSNLLEQFCVRFPGIKFEKGVKPHDKVDPGIICKRILKMSNRIDGIGGPRPI